MTSEKEVARLRATIVEQREIMMLQRGEIGRLQKKLRRAGKLLVKVLEEVDDAR
jgi:hypothetical protein